MKLQSAAIVLVTSYIGYLLAERTVTIDAPNGTHMAVTFVGQYSYIDDTPPGEHLEVPVKIELFNNGETAPYNVTIQLIEGYIGGADITDEERKNAFDKLEEEKLQELKSEFASNTNNE